MRVVIIFKKIYKRVGISADVLPGCTGGVLGLFQFEYVCEVESAFFKIELSAKSLLIHHLDISTIEVMSFIPLGMEIQPMDLSGVVSELYHSFMYFYTFLSKVLKSCALFLGL